MDHEQKKRRWLILSALALVSIAACGTFEYLVFVRPDKQAATVRALSLVKQVAPVVAEKNREIEDAIKNKSSSTVARVLRALVAPVRTAPPQEAFIPHIVTVPENKIAKKKAPLRKLSGKSKIKIKKRAIRRDARKTTKIFPRLPIVNVVVEEEILKDRLVPAAPDLALFQELPATEVTADPEETSAPAPAVVLTEEEIAVDRITPAIPDLSELYSSERWPAKASGETFVFEPIAPEPVLEEVPKEQMQDLPEAVVPVAVYEDNSEEPELFLHFRAGYGARFLRMEQSGAFGGGSGMVVPMNALSLEAGFNYGDLRLDAGTERFSADFGTSTVNINSTQAKEFRSFFLKAGYGIFHLGVHSKTAPVVRASGTTLEWVEAASFHGVSGFKLEKVYSGSRKKPFRVGLDIEGTTPLGIAGKGAARFSSPKGYGANLGVYAEKTVRSGDAGKLNLGLKAGAAYDRLQWHGDWSGAAGGITRTIQDYSFSVFMGFEF